MVVTPCILHNIAGIRIELSLLLSVTYVNYVTSEDRFVQPFWRPFSHAFDSFFFCNKIQQFLLLGRQKGGTTKTITCFPLLLSRVHHSLRSLVREVL